ncbi:hypothetical protein [Micromonospora sp. b486]|uniref:hypothetical protein n=1 Tax=Micromonospora sp. b486 TaxID=3053986 RepID=UPI00259CAB5B|nr:hypothetical protein [Micromonospora sp. b486]MDM4778175.1 hypothetical protein [Micromonospora sp. b486]
MSGATLYRVSSGGSGELDYALYSVNNFATIQGFGTLYLRTTAHQHRHPDVRARAR